MFVKNGIVSSGGVYFSHRMLFKIVNIPYIMEKRWWILIIVVIIIILISFLILIKFSNNTQSIQQPHTNTNSSESVVDNFDECQNIDDHNITQNDYLTKINCYMGAKDLTACSNIKEKNFIQDYIDACIKGVAINRNNESICNLMKTDKWGLKDQCYGEIALKKLNSIICENIKINPYYSESQQWKDKCYEEIATKTNNTNLCDNVSPDEKNNCINWVNIHK